MVAAAAIASAAAAAAGTATRNRLAAAAGIEHGQLSLCIPAFAFHAFDFLVRL